MKPSLLKTISWLCCFAIAMGFLESSVVIYLRALYYPGGFQFPLQIIPTAIANVELWREVATIVMLVGAGYLAGTSKLTRFACFLIAFAVWDIFYYVFLFVFIAWPDSLFTWDILFLLPFPWTGPVIAPCLVAAGMFLFGVGILYFAGRNKTVSVTRFEWMLLLGGAFVMILSFLYDYLHLTYRQHRGFSTLPSQEGLLAGLVHYVPASFNWLLFGSGLLCSCSGVIVFIKRSLTSKLSLL